MAEQTKVIIYDGREGSPSERLKRLDALSHEAGFESMCNEFRYQLKVEFDELILNEETAPHEREVLVAARARAVKALHPAKLIDRGRKRAAAELKKAEREAGQ
jgi:hypothetical protein|tara:strand:- start:553 stop:861 length:309 start_codon:yes stop_codon:yes gene_type:complete